MRGVRRFTGLTDNRIRHYDQLGLLGPVARSEAGYRLFAAEQFDTLRQIAQWRTAGLSLKEIRALLAHDQAALARSLASRREELARLVRIIDRLERANADLDDWSKSRSA